METHLTPPEHDTSHLGATSVPTSEVLLRAVRGESEKVSVKQILDALDARSFGLAVLLFSLPSIVPMPPGVPTVVGIILLIVAVQMVIGREDLWLPGILSKREFDRKAIVGAFEGLAPRLQTIERVMKPRLLFLTGRAGAVFIGVIVLIMAIVLILPLPPGGNFPPALACAVLGMGLAQRDGAIVAVGLVVSVVALVAVSFVTVVFIQQLPAMLDWLAGLVGLRQGAP